MRGRRSKAPLLYRNLSTPDGSDNSAAVMRDWFFDAAPAGGTDGDIKWWSGSAWMPKPVKVWNGSAWVTKPLKRWNGSAWVLSNGV
jgi:hypothetical protein